MNVNHDKKSFFLEAYDRQIDVLLIIT